MKNFKSLFTSKEHYQAFRQEWSKFTNGETKYQLTASHHALYAMLRGQDWRKGFTTVTRPTKVAQICYPYVLTASQIAWEDIKTCGTFKHEWQQPYAEKLIVPFGETVSLEMLRAVAESMGDLKEYTAPEPINFNIEEAV